VIHFPAFASPLGGLRVSEIDKRHGEEKGHLTSVSIYVSGDCVEEIILVQGLHRLVIYLSGGRRVSIRSL
jgi:hypothetical protein